MNRSGFLRTVFVLLAVFCLLHGGQLQAEERILLIGDSWAQGIWMAGLLDKALAEAGFPEMTAIGESCALGGTRADQWNKPEYREKILDALALSPTVDMIHLIIGGNDVLKRIRDTNVFTACSENKRDKEWDLIAADIRDLVEFCLSIEQVKCVGLAGYDYLNASTAKEALGMLGQNFDFGGMSQEQVNACMIALEKRKKDLAASIKGCVYIHNFGLLQHHFNDPEGTPLPGAPPEYVPFPGGDPARPMPDAAFTKVSFGGREFSGDGIHPGEEAHMVMLRNGMQCCYVPYLRSLTEKQATAEPDDRSGEN